MPFKSKRKRRKKSEPAPTGWTLPDIEAQASFDGNEILLGPGKIKIVRTVIAYEPYPEAGPGRWREAYVDEVVEAALEAARVQHITPSMFRALRAANFEAIERLRARVHGDEFET